MSKLFHIHSRVSSLSLKLIREKYPIIEVIFCEKLKATYCNLLRHFVTTILILFVKRLFLPSIAARRETVVHALNKYFLSCLPRSLTSEVQRGKVSFHRNNFPADLKIDILNGWNNQPRWSSNYHWQDNLSANMLYFIKSLFDRNVCYYFVVLVLG